MEPYYWLDTTTPHLMTASNDPDGSKSKSHEEEVQDRWEQTRSLIEGSHRGLLEVAASPGHDHPTNTCRRAQKKQYARPACSSSSNPLSQPPNFSQRTFNLTDVHSPMTSAQRSYIPLRPRQLGGNAQQPQTAD